MWITFNKFVGIEVMHRLANVLVQSRPIIGAIHLRSWNITSSASESGNDVVPPTLTDAEARCIALQHPNIRIRAWFGMDSAGKPILRSAIVGSTEEINAREPGDSEDAELPDTAPPPAATAVPKTPIGVNKRQREPPSFTGTTTSSAVPPTFGRTAGSSSDAAAATSSSGAVAARPAPPIVVATPVPDPSKP
jgi:hypothetical protein